MTLLLLVSAAGGLGAVLRFVLETVLRRWSRRLPIVIGAINVTGSFLLGLVVGMGAQAALTPTWQLGLGVGFLGGFTTFSTASEDTRRLLQDERRTTDATGYASGVLGLSVLAAWAGWMVGSAGSA